MTSNMQIPTCRSRITDRQLPTTNGQSPIVNRQPRGLMQDIVRRLIVIVLFEGVDLLDVTGPPEVFSLARRETEDAAGYHVVLAAESMDPVTTSAGVRILPDITFREAVEEASTPSSCPARWRSTASAVYARSSTPSWSAG